MKQGLTIVEVLVGIVILTFVSVTAASFFAQMGIFEKRADRAEQVAQILVDTSSVLRRTTYEEVHQSLCLDSGALPGPRQGVCIAGSQFNTAPEAPVSDVGVQVTERRRRWNGDFNSDGGVCVEVYQCRVLAADQLIEISLRAYFKNPDSRSNYLTQDLVFRKARW
jgi:type II secretory pathway pseudopilin PulG